jgi:MFS family permease
VIATAGLGAAMCAAALAPSFALLLAVMPAMGLAHIFTASSSNAMIQLDASPTMRGRVTSLRTMTVIGSTPVGGMFAGIVARTAGPRWAMAVGGLGCFAGLLFARALVKDRRATLEPALEPEPRGIGRSPNSAADPAPARAGLTPWSSRR